LEASTLQAPVALHRLSVPASLLRLRSDEQLVASFRGGSEEAFRAIHDRYRVRLFAYSRQMLGGSHQDAEDVMQDVFVRVYRALRSNDRPVSLRAWLYRIAHNRCIDHLRCPPPPLADVFDVSHTPQPEPSTVMERREDLRRLVTDVHRLPEQQRSALLMRELQGLSYEELAASLDVSVASVKSLLVRARSGLVDAAQARDTACASVRHDLALACDRGVRCSGLVRRHLRDCDVCREYRDELRGVRRRLGALVPVGPLGLLWQVGGVGGGGAAAGGSVGAGVGASSAIATATKVALVCAAAAVTAGGALGIAPRALLHALPVPLASGAAPHHRTLPPATGTAPPPPIFVRSAQPTTAAAPLARPVVTVTHAHRTHRSASLRAATAVVPLDGSGLATTGTGTGSSGSSSQTGGTSAPSSTTAAPSGTTGASGSSSGISPTPTSATTGDDGSTGDGIATTTVINGPMAPATSPGSASGSSPADSPTTTTPPTGPGSGSGSGTSGQASGSTTTAGSSAASADTPQPSSASGASVSGSPAATAGTTSGQASTSAAS
jgi:RNA polymerase sigma factor (sigma-70 family)